MAKTTSKIRFKAKLLRPAAPKGASWTFLVLPKRASAKLPTRGMTTVEGTVNGAPFRATLEPDGQRSHWLVVTKKMRDAAGAEVGDTVTLSHIRRRSSGAKIPPDLRKALAAAPKAKVVWSDLTPNARRDWVQWITCAKQTKTRARRVEGACDMLAKGKRRVCCFDRSGYYAGGFSAPKAAD